MTRLNVACGMILAAAAFYCCIGAVAARQSVLGGVSAPAGRFPYHVAVAPELDGKREWCGGSVIAKDLVLTSASCLGDPDVLKRGDVYVKYGTLNTPTSDAGGITVKAIHVMLHVDAVIGTGDADLAVVKVASPLPITPIKIASDEDMKLLPDAELLFPGWGTVKFGSKTEEIPAASLRVGAARLNTGDCGEDQDHSLCVGLSMSHDLAVTNIQKNCGDLDAGGALVLSKLRPGAPMDAAPSGDRLVGVAREPECDVNSEFVRVAHYREWISCMVSSKGYGPCGVDFAE